MSNPQIECTKERGEGKRDIRIVYGDPRGRHVIIIDDAIMEGGTTLKCKDVLFEAGAAKVSAFATHGRFAEDSWPQFFDAGFETIWVTDSCPVQAAQVTGKPPFQVISLAESLTRVIRGNDGV